MDKIFSPCTITFSGRIIDEACSFESDSQNIAVNLGVYPKSYFVDQDTTTEAKPFSLKITGCTITSNDVGENLPADHVRLTFTDKNYSGSAQSNGLLTNSSGNQTNVGILVKYQAANQASPETQLFDNESTGSQVLTLNQFEYAKNRSIDVEEAILNFEAAMKRTGGSAADAGNVTGEMNVLLETF